ncbi:MAG: exosome complex RNA-binding protein Csl4 [Candidatus Lokiarchaeota archaeon]|jgi:exosome complex component CSL4|nr:exosome complex RNA-binding protein Csl4 [Candidatus Lokiarchaeota archaeon]
MKGSIKTNEIVITGQYLGVVEEYLPDKDSTYTKDGKIYATKTGIVSIDKNKREIEIRSHQNEDRKVVEMGDIVIGTILFLRQYSVGLNFQAINQKLHFNSSYFGNIHVSQISNKYVEKIADAYQTTDIVRAKVIEQEQNEYKLSTSGNNLGVIHADCIICGTPLEKIGFNKLRCTRCGNIESRKIASDYRNVIEKLRY